MVSGRSVRRSYLVTTHAAARCYLPTACSSGESLGRFARRRSSKGPLTTKELALYLMKAKGMDLGDAVLAKAIGNRLIHSLRMQQQRGSGEREGKRKGVSVWRLCGPLV